MPYDKIKRPCKWCTAMVTGKLFCNNNCYNLYHHLEDKRTSWIMDVKYIKAKVEDVVSFDWDVADAFV